MTLKYCFSGRKNRMLSTGEKILIKNIITELEETKKLNNSYIELYENFDNEDLKLILSSYHYNIIKTFKYINSRVPTKYIHADPSREIIDLIEKVQSFLGNVNSTKLELVDKYKKILDKIELFIQPLGGTTIPDTFLKIDIVEVDPIFVLKESVIKESFKESLNLRPVGKGSYAQVYSFYDNFYHEKYILKRLNKNASEKDFERFLREFKIMKQLNSLFIAKVYNLNEEAREYTMEYLDITLYDYIQKNSLTFKEKEKIIRQILLAFKYLDKRNILHRDISPKNILLKIYDDIICVKITDFGLVKLQESTLTDPNSEFRGSLNDPKLNDIGFDKYDSSYEMYALTRLIAFILTGKSNFSKIKDKDVLDFLNKGIADKIENRYQNIYDLEKNFKILRNKLKS